MEQKQPEEKSEHKRTNIHTAPAVCLHKRNFHKIIQIYRTSTAEVDLEHIQLQLQLMKLFRDRGQKNHLKA